MVGIPFGKDAAGQPIRHINGTTFDVVFDHLKQCVTRRVEAGWPPAMPLAEKQQRLAQAQTAIVEEVVKRLNAAVPDPAYQVTPAYVQRHGQFYSLEYGHFLRETCATLADEPDFFFNAYAQAEYRAFAFLIRPLSLEHAYTILPRIFAKVTDHDFRAIHIAAGVARFEWRAAKVLPLLPAALHRTFTHSYCRSFQGVLTAAPRVHSHRPPAQVQELRCQMDGAACCEWDVTWDKPKTGGWFGWLKR
jgi:hypothetical protein